MSDKGFKIRIKIHGFTNLSIMRELIDEFLPPDNYELLEDDGFRTDSALHINLEGSCDKDEIKRELFSKLSAITGKRPDWGILTGVRPVKLAGEIMSGSSRDKALEILTKDYFLTENKAELIVDTYSHQYNNYGNPKPDTVGVYIGIPFCPTRCLYCSFASNQVPESEIERYMPALLHEIEYTGNAMKHKDVRPETIYIGGGTPTTLTAEQLDRMLTAVETTMDLSELKEFTIEAGRPDTITEDKLMVMKNHGVGRISINPQSMKARTLELIGRSHSPEDIVKAFDLAKSVGFDSINADLIAGLPEENSDDFRNTLDKVIEMGADNITIHTLAVKRASRLKDIDEDYHYKVAETVGKMLAEARQTLAAEGLSPYYLYRQKHMAGFFENTGYCREGIDCLYNIRIMDEHQTILALGAGGISKIYYPSTDKLERIPNVTNYEQYIDRIDEMCERKENKYFTQEVL
ncbi:coproporphyrinogen dehydrogenase HemZ [Aminicella lysinilytica]|uniref:coproporphyrinogen dehydrogenase HemZ n=1 Tax=Aminicella lysinilytica TaxID=433323 RepID=UPI0026F36A4D|nr:coproporphyrinogen dehydrogenase HemZ [Aminicella lysinilytica]